MAQDQDTGYISTVLIADDESSVRKTLKVLLQKEGYNLEFAEGGQEALAKAVEHTPDMILLDVMMPDMDGFEVCRRLREIPTLAEVPILMITALDDRDSRSEAIEAGADDFISKPIDRVALRTRIRATLRLNRYRRLLQERIRRQEAETVIQAHERELDVLREIERLQNEFISNASHELRTPLSTITLLSSNLDANYNTLDDDQRQKMISRIRKQAQALNELIGNVLEISRLESKQGSVERQPVDLAQFVQEEVNLQLPLAQEKSLSLQVEGDNPLMVLADPNQLQQIIRNLLNNAIKYTPAGGQIICEGQVDVSNESNKNIEETWPGSAMLPAGNWIAFRIVDTGIGIPQQHLPHLFERFYRVQPQGSVRGTGLGLAIVQELIELHHGYIAVTSSPGQGTTFAIYLPQAGGIV